MARKRLIPVGSLRPVILEAGARAFQQRGLNNVSMRMIAEMVGISAPSIYHHFESKDELIAAIMNKSLQLHMDAVVPTLTGEGSPADKIHAHVVAHVTLEISYRHYFGLFDQFLRNEPRLPENLRDEKTLSEFAISITLREGWYNYVQRLGEILEEGRRNGMFHFASREITTAAILGLGKGTALWLDVSPILSVEHIAKDCADMALNMLGNSKSSASSAA